MNDIKVKKEYVPTRCEICHQSDQFDSIKNYCYRCGRSESTLAANNGHIQKQILQGIALQYLGKLLVFLFFVFALFMMAMGSTKHRF